MNRSHHQCIHHIRTPSPDSFTYILGIYMFPFVFGVGLIGNLLNLIVLRRLKTRIVCFLSAMVVMDLCFFIAMLLLNLIVYEPLSTSRSFMKFYYQAKMTLVTLANWFSTASIWFVVMVTIERLIAIRTPLLARTFWTIRRFATIIVTVLVVTWLLVLPHYFWYKPWTLPDCKNANESVFVLIQISKSHPYYKWIKLSMTVCPSIVFTVCILLGVLNAVLIHYLRLSRRNVNKFGLLLQQQNAEHENKVTITVSIIVTTFFIFNFPSVVIYFCRIFDNSTSKLMIPSLIANYLVTLGKALNFPLYCFSSANFRKQLAQFLKELFCCAKTHAGKHNNNSIWRRLSSETNSMVGSMKSTLKHRTYSQCANKSRLGSVESAGTTNSNTTTATATTNGCKRHSFDMLLWH